MDMSVKALLLHVCHYLLVVVVLQAANSRDWAVFLQMAIIFWLKFGIFVCFAFKACLSTFCVQVYIMISEKNFDRGPHL